MNEPKSPHDWLLERHAPVVPQLDAIRRAALQEVITPGESILRELFWPHRHAWAALGIAWLAIITVHLAAARRQHPVAAVPTETIIAWIEQLKRPDATFAQIDSYR